MKKMTPATKDGLRSAIGVLVVSGIVASLEFFGVIPLSGESLSVALVGLVVILSLLIGANVVVLWRFARCK